VHVILYDRFSGKQRVKATIRMQNGEVVVDPPVAPPIQDEINVTRARIVGDTEFFKTLLVVFNGSYVWAELAQE
jgi:hypothetical protein